MEETEYNINTIEVPHPKKKFWKFWIVFIMCNIGFLIIVARLFSIQVINGDQYKEKARKQHESRIKVNAERGNIYDRNGLLLATTYKSISIAADPTILKSKKDRVRIARALSKPTGLKSKDILKKLNSATSAFVWIKRGLKPGNLIELDTIKHKGLMKISEPKRKYPYGSLCGQIIGCTNIENKGIEGLERYWDSDLQGESGYKIMLRDALGNLLPSPDTQLDPPVNGNSLILTIDANLQRILEYELMQGVIKHEARSGTALAMNPKTGEILAMASFPNYNPNELKQSNILSGSMKNRAITDLYEPGSTFKLVTASAAIEEGLKSPSDTVNGHGGRLRRKGFVIRDDHPMGIVPFREAIVHSSNVICGEIGIEIPSAKFYKYVRDFGFIVSSDIELPGEMKGYLKPYRKFTESYKAYLGHGYGFSTTALHILSAYAAIANDGVLMKPFIVKKRLDNKKRLLEVYDPITVRRVVSQATADTVTNMLVEVVKRGTAKRVRVKGVKIAGKTGTSKQLINGDYTNEYYGSFAGFFPADDPQIAMLVVIDQPQGIYYGGATAGPVFKNITERWLALSPELTSSVWAVKDSASFYKDSVLVPDITGMNSKDAQELLSFYNLELQNNSAKEGIISIQSPEPGIMAPLNSQIHAIVDKFLIADSIKTKHKFIPDLTGLSARRAAAVLHKEGIKTRIIGSGKVKSQILIQNDSSAIVVGLKCECHKGR